MDGLAAAGHLHVVIHHARFQGTRPVEGDGGHDVREALRGQTLEEAHIQRTFHLEEAVHVAAAHEREGLLVISGDLLGYDLLARALVDVLAGPREHA